MKSALRVLSVPREDQVEMLKEHIKKQAKYTIKFMEPTDAQDSASEKIFDLLQKVYGDKVIGTRLRVL